MAIDKWSSREQLFLASAVCSSGENWPSVSRSVKIVCSRGHMDMDEDFFSQKSCAVQYRNLLGGSSDSTETSKRNTQRTSDVIEPLSTTIADGLMCRLTAERIHELKSEICSEQDEYANIYAEVKAIQAGQLTEQQLQAMWAEIEQQHETQRIEEMKLENRMREREMRKQEMEPRDWRSTTSVVPGTTTTSSTDAEIRLQSSLINVEEIIASGKPMLFQIEEIGISQQQQRQAQSTQTGAAAPLLSSLLKSPTTTSSSILSSAAAGNSSARASAPTITTLLTGGSIPHTNQPMITLKSTIPPNEAAQLLARPISGPPAADSPAANAIGAHNLLSPSQSAPTLSMLLEKNKCHSSTNSVGRKSAELTSTSSFVSLAGITTEAGPQKSHVLPTFDSNNEEVPMDIEEDISAAAAAATIASISGDFDEPDDSTEEEQQLMEVFKNIGNIDELDIDVAAVIDDEEVDFLKGVDEEEPNTEELVNFKVSQQQEQNLISGATIGTSNIRDGRENSLKTTHERDTRSDTAKLKEESQIIDQTKEENVKVETIISSDDSNDNIPLAAVASLENKERENLQEKYFLKEKVESAYKNEDAQQPSASFEDNNRSGGVSASAEAIAAIEAVDSSACNATDPVMVLTGAADVRNVNLEQSPPESNSSDVIVIPTDDESNGAKQKLKFQEADNQVSEEKQQEDEAQRKFKGDETNVESKIPRDVVTYDSTLTEANAIEYETNPPPPPTISIVDTDDSSTTDISGATRKDEERALSSSRHNISHQQRKSLQDITKRSESSKMDDDSGAAATLARPPVLRKLRDRDRSESPMIDDETTTTSDHSINQRSRRRYSSTPVIDSIPNSPASSERDRDDPRESRASKKSLMSIYNGLQTTNKITATIFQRAFSENDDDICQRPMDLITIKRNIDSGAIRSVNELQRDVMLMCQNIMMLCKATSATYKVALNLIRECQTIREFAANAHDSESATARIASTDKEAKDNKHHNSSGTRVRGVSRKSQRIT